MPLLEMNGWIVLSEHVGSMQVGELVNSLSVKPMRSTRYILTYITRYAILWPNNKSTLSKAGHSGKIPSIGSVEAFRISDYQLPMCVILNAPIVSRMGIKARRMGSGCR